MGIKRIIDITQLPSKYHNFILTPTTDGVCDSVYLLDDKYVVKYFENSKNSLIDNEITLLNILSSIRVPKVLDRFIINNKEAVVYTQINGKSKYNPSLKNIKEIGEFLKLMHSKTKNLSNNNIKIFSKNIVLDMIIRSKHEPLLKYFNEIEIELKDDGIIHGDLFVDNAKFLNNKLTGVYDFSDACVGDFKFDLAVVAISWCYDEVNLNYQKLKTLLLSYKFQESYTEFKPYLQYALLYYATRRYINNRDYQELIDKFKLLKL